MNLVLVLNNIRSAHNVGAIWRTAAAAGVHKMILVGLTPHPARASDPRPPYIIDRTTQQLAKTALGAEKVLPWSYEPDIASALTALRQDQYRLAALEIAPQATNLFAYQPPSRLALVLGHETEGLQADVLSACDITLQIPMTTAKESLNVGVAAGIAAYHLLRSQPTK
jgi:23S rRNA (guanosine2251-2'-O)-methyltransferase